jgi:Holliday junction resolvase RusA-like endonuclease
VKARRQGGFIRIYTPNNADQWKAEVRSAVDEMSTVEGDGGGPSSLFDGPLALHLTFYLTRPQRLMRKADPIGPVSHVATPDVDNLTKAVMDALTDTKRVWRDDSQVQDLLVSKRYSGKNGVTGCLISIGPSSDPLPSLFD